MSVVETKLVTEWEYADYFRRSGAIYFIEDKNLNAVKIGHSIDPIRRLSELQVGSASTLTIIGLIAAKKPVERIAHRWNGERHRSGEWFQPIDLMTQWLRNMTYDYPMKRNIWTIEPDRWEIRGQ